MTCANTAKRPQCARCLRPSSACICAWIRPTAHEVEVLVLQHPRERARAKGTARLLQLSLQHCRLVVGEEFVAGDLQSLLDGTVPGELPLTETRQALLLYPDTPQDQALGLFTPPLLAPDLLPDPPQLRLVVLDGTWRESRKMLYRNPLLQRLPRLALRELAPSKYLIRKAHDPDQLSTLEATCAALTQLEGDREKIQPLLSAFEGFVAQQRGYQAHGLRASGGSVLPA
jgi:DTW domain-containing protein YfiP